MARPDHADKIARQFNRAWILPRTTAKLRPMSEEVQRRLAAIVLADVVGYSRLMGVDEVGTLNALRTHRKEFIDAKITQHGGRIVKTMGDGLLLEYPSDVAAVQCAVEVQEGMAARKQTHRIPDRHQRRRHHHRGRRRLRRRRQRRRPPGIPLGTWRHLHFRPGS